MQRQVASSLRLLLSRATQHSCGACASSSTSFASSGSAWHVSSRTAFAHAKANAGEQVVTQTLAQPGEGIAECELIQWHVQEGDAIQEFEAVCEVQSDKASVEITSRYSGHVRKLYGQVGEMIKVDDPLFDVAVSDPVSFGVSGPDRPSVSEPGPFASAASSSSSDDSIASAAAVPPTVAAPSPSIPDPSSTSGPRDADPGTRSWGPGAASPHASTSAATTGARVLASPVVRRLAYDNGVDLTRVEGSGTDGRVLIPDVRAYLRQNTDMEDAVALVDALDSHYPDSDSGLGDSDVELDSSINNTRPPAAARCDDSAAGGDGIVPLQGFRRAMVRAMAATVSIPHFHFCDEVRMDALIELRRYMQAQNAADGSRLTLMPFMVKALSIALRAHPEVNARLSEDMQALHVIEDHNVGVAMATDSGLVVPSIKSVQLLSIPAIAAELERLRVAAAANRLSQADLSGATVTLSNIGSIGGTYASPIVNPPEIAICALGRLRPALVDTEGEIASVMNISWGADHRALDGAALAKFNNTWKALLEEPANMLMHMS